MPIVHVPGPIDRGARLNLGVGSQRFADERLHVFRARDFAFKRVDHESVRGALRFFGKAGDSGLEFFGQL